MKAISGGAEEAALRGMQEGRGGMYARSEGIRQCLMMDRDKGEEREGTGVCRTMGDVPEDRVWAGKRVITDPKT